MRRRRDGDSSGLGGLPIQGGPGLSRKDMNKISIHVAMNSEASQAHASRLVYECSQRGLGGQDIVDTFNDFGIEGLYMITGLYEESIEDAAWGLF